MTKLLLSALGGGAGTAIDVAVLVALHEHGAAIAPAAFVAALSGAAACFTINKYVAFRDRTPITFRQVGAFVAVAIATALLMAIGMSIACDRLHVPYLLAKAICAVLIFVCWSYPAQRKLVFDVA